MPTLYKPTSAFLLHRYIQDVGQALALAPHLSFHHFSEDFVHPFIQGQRNSVAAANLAAAIRPEVEAWELAEQQDGPARRATSMKRIAARAPWYLDSAEGRHLHIQAVQNLSLVQRALAAAERELDQTKSEGLKLARNIARAARVVDRRMLPAIVMVAERERIAKEVKWGSEPEDVGIDINRRLRTMRGIPSNG